MRAVLRVVLLLSSLLLISSCAKEPLYQEEGFVFGTRIEISIYGVEETQAKIGVTAIMQEFQRLHNLLHAWQPSTLTDINTAFAESRSITIAPELFAILQNATQFYKQSEGLFNPAIGGLIQLWGFQADEYKSALPKPEQIATLLSAHPKMTDIVLHKYQVSNNEVISAYSKNHHVQLDLGGYAKGYALDRAKALLKEQGIHHALINIGGNILAIGKHGSRPWRVGIQHPRKPGPIASLELHDGEAIGTSGDYQRYFELDGIRYCHLIDPRTGQPVTGVQAVTVITNGLQAGTLSDVASKPLFIAGSTGLQAAAQKMQLNDVMLITSDGAVQLSASMQKRLKFTDSDIITKVMQ